MKRVLVPVACGAILAILAVVSPVKGQTPPPPPNPGGGIPPPPPPPCPPGCPTATPTVVPTATPTPTSTPTPTNTPIPLFVQLKLAHKSVKAGATQKVSVTTLPAAHVTIQVVFPNKAKKHHGGVANDSGAYAWSFKQPSGVTTRTSTTAKVTVTVDNGTTPMKASKKYKVG